MSSRWRILHQKNVQAAPSPQDASASAAPLKAWQNYPIMNGHSLAPTEKTTTMPLDNPIWSALTSHQSGLAVGDSLARRFPADVGPLAGLIDQSEAAYASLAPLGRDDEQLVLFMNEPPSPPTDWHLDVAGHLTQMVLEEAPSTVRPHWFETRIEPMTEVDIPEMLVLTQLTKPGPFRQRTRELGGYVGIRESGRLAAMAGERLHMPGYTEISAVCTHPDFQGKGYAGALIISVAQKILARGETPFLHAWIDNHNAIRLYEKLGFRQRRIIHLGVVRAPRTAALPLSNA